MTSSTNPIAREPDEAMVEAGKAELHSNLIDELKLRRIYLAMEAARTPTKDRETASPAPRDTLVEALQKITSGRRSDAFHGDDSGCLCSRCAMAAGALRAIALTALNSTQQPTRETDREALLRDALGELVERVTDAWPELADLPPMQKARAALIKRRGGDHD